MNPRSSGPSRPRSASPGKGMELLAFNHMTRAKQQHEAPKKSKPDGLEVLDSALDAHWERRVVQTSFFENGTPGQCRPRSEYACISADEGFEQFLTPAELREWRQYKDSLDERLAELAGRSLQCRKAAVDDDQILALEEELDPLQFYPACARLLPRRLNKLLCPVVSLAWSWRRHPRPAKLV